MINSLFAILTLTLVSFAQAGPFGLKSGMTADEILKAGFKSNIDQIREIIKFTNQSSFNSKLKFIIIDDVESLNINSSNAQLKSLEETETSLTISYSALL